jgi:hypothetical protein
MQVALLLIKYVSIQHLCMESCLGILPDAAAALHVICIVHTPSHHYGAHMQCSTSDSQLKWLSELTSWLRLVRLLRLYPLLRSLVVLSLTVRL